MKCTFPSTTHLNIACNGVNKLLGKLNSHKVAGLDGMKP